MVCTERGKRWRRGNEGVSFNAYARRLFELEDKMVCNLKLDVVGSGVQEKAVLKRNLIWVGTDKSKFEIMVEQCFRIDHTNQHQSTCLFSTSDLPNST